MEQIYDKKIDIIDASIYLFSNKGFASTSVQDIATKCNISKATIYKFFKSKEEILIHIIDYVNKQMIVNVENIDLKAKDNKIDILKAKLNAFFEHLYDKKNFSIMIYENQSLMKNPKFKNIILQNRQFLLNWYSSILLDAFGEKIEPILWDIVLVMTGIIREFNYIFIIKETISHDFNEIASFIVKSVISIIDFHHKDTPLVPPDLFEFFKNKSTINKDVFLNEWKNTISKIKNKLNECNNICNKADLLDATSELEKEMKKEQPRRFLIDSLLLYLSNYKIIEPEILFLKSLYIKSGI